MIVLTQINGERFILNAELIRYVEQRPDTFVTLTTGERLIVLESMDQVMELAIRYQQSKHLVPTPLPGTHLESRDCGSASLAAAEASR